MLTLEGMRIRQGSFTLQADVTFRAPVTALLGPSGAGKSTLLNAVAGFVAPSEGRCLWQGQDVTAKPPAERPVAMLFQDNNLFPHLTVAQNLALALTTGRPSRAQLDQIADALVHVDLAGMESRKPGALSGGQQSRVALARALLQDRPILLLDEPFAALGPALKRDMLKRVRAEIRARKLTAIMVSHDPEDARLIADEACVVADGKVTPPTETEALLTTPPRALADYLGA